MCRNIHVHDRASICRKIAALSAANVTMLQKDFNKEKCRYYKMEHQHENQILKDQLLKSSKEGKRKRRSLSAMTESGGGVGWKECGGGFPLYTLDLKADH